VHLGKVPDEVLRDQRRGFSELERSAISNDKSRRS
jgi:hypothetical protein